jgi:hypothetical protein
MTSPAWALHALNNLLERRRVIYVDPRRSQFTRGNMHRTSSFYMGLTSAEDQWPVL